MKDYLKSQLSRIKRKLFPPDKPQDIAVIVKVRSEKLTYCNELKLRSIAHTVREIERKDIPGILIECGCALGGSAIVIAKAKSQRRRLNVYDVFDMIPPPGNEDPADVHKRYECISAGEALGIDGNKYYGYENDLVAVVENNFLRHSLELEGNAISLIQGMVQDTLVLKHEQVAFAHIDVDWYEPVAICLHRIFPQLVVGGIIILDDYFAWGGCKKAVDEFLSGLDGKCSEDTSSGAMKLTKQS